MAGLEIVIVFSILLLFGLIVGLVIRSERRGRAAKLQINQALGFTPIDPPPELVQKISHLYRSIRIKSTTPERNFYELKNVFKRRLPDGEMFILDLIDTTGEDDSYTEQQAVGIISPYLSLPAFVIFPKPDMGGTVSVIANRFLGWVVSKFGNPVDFPDYPEFTARFLVSSPDPGATRQFLDARKIRRLVQTEPIGIHAGGDVFTLSQIDSSTRPLTQEMLSKRVQQAMNLYSIFTS